MRYSLKKRFFSMSRICAVLTLLPAWLHGHFYRELLSGVVLECETAIMVGGQEASAERELGRQLHRM